MKIKNIDLISISNELTGLKTENIDIKGLLNEKVSLKTKYWLSKLYKEVEDNKKDFVEIYKAWATENESEDYQQFLNENKDLALTEVELKEYTFDIEDFDFKTDYGYYGFMGLFIDKEN